MSSFRIPKTMEDRYCSILLEGISAVEVKIKKVDDTEVIAEYVDKEEIHINQEKIIAYWPDDAKMLRLRKAKERAQNRRATKGQEMAQDSL